MKIENVEIGRKVIYKSFGKTEFGVITSFNEKYVFVRYGNDINSKSTRPSDLEYGFNKN